MFVCSPQFEYQKQTVANRHLTDVELFSQLICFGFIHTSLRLGFRVDLHFDRTAPIWSSIMQINWVKPAEPLSHSLNILFVFSQIKYKRFSYVKRSNLAHCEGQNNLYCLFNKLHYKLSVVFELVLIKSYRYS